MNWKLAWRALGQFPYGILEEFLSQANRNWSAEFLIQFSLLDGELPEFIT